MRQYIELKRDYTTFNVYLIYIYDIFVVKSVYMPSSKLITDNPELLHYITGKLHITVLGGIKFTGLDRMKVTLKMIATDNKQDVFRHNADLYNNIQVSQLVDRSAEVLDYNATEINTAINNLTTALEEYRAEHLESLKPKAPKKIQLTETERKAAINFLKS